MDVVVKANREGFGPLADTFGTRAVREAERLAEPDAEGWQRLRLAVDWPEEAASRLLGLAPYVELLEPPALRSEILALANGAVERYSAP